MSLVWHTEAIYEPPFPSPSRFSSTGRRRKERPPPAGRGRRLRATTHVGEDQPRPQACNEPLRQLHDDDELPSCCAPAGIELDPQCHSLAHAHRLELQSMAIQLGDLESVRCKATQTQNVQKKSSSATFQRDKKGKVQGPKLDDGSGGFPPFHFGKGGGGGGGGSNYFGRFLLFSSVLLLDYLKEFEKYLLTRRHRTGDDVGNGCSRDRRLPVSLALATCFSSGEQGIWLPNGT